MQTKKIIKKRKEKEPPPSLDQAAQLTGHLAQLANYQPTAPPWVASPPVPPTGEATGARPRPTTSPAPTPGGDKAAPTPRPPPISPTCPLSLPLPLPTSSPLASSPPVPHPRPSAVAVVLVVVAATGGPAPADPVGELRRGRLLRLMASAGARRRCSIGSPSSPSPAAVDLLRLRRRPCSS